MDTFIKVTAGSTTVGLIAPLKKNSNGICSVLMGIRVHRPWFLNRVGIAELKE